MSESLIHTPSNKDSSARLAGQSICLHRGPMASRTLREHLPQGNTLNLLVAEGQSGNKDLMIRPIVNLLAASEANA